MYIRLHPQCPVMRIMPHRGKIRLASQFIGWYQMAMNMRAFRYATLNPYLQKTENFFKNTTHYTSFPSFSPLFTHKKAEK